MTRRELIDLCLSFPSAYEDYPFAGAPGEEETAVMRHKANRKSFALIMERDGKLCVNLKCDPREADFLRRVYEGVKPGWHMNKEHWNTVTTGSDVPEEELRRQIANSYDLVKPKKKNGHRPPEV